LLDTLKGKLGSMREIEMTDMRSILIFMVEFPQWKQTERTQSNEQRVYGDEVDFA
jgi:hypothetical protein